MQDEVFADIYREIFPFWENISDGDRDYICRNSYILTYPKGKNIHNGEECSGVILVRSGSLRLYMMSDEGKDITLYRLHQILFMSMDRRLAIFLSDESARTGSDTIALTHGQIARYMGSAREVVSRMLKYFAGEGMVEASRGGVTILDKRRLRSLTL